MPRLYHRSDFFHTTKYYRDWETWETPNKESKDERYGNSTFVRCVFTERGEKVGKKGGHGQQGLCLYRA